MDEIKIEHEYVDIVLHVVLAIQNFINIALHTIGFYLLYSLDNKNSQKIFLLNLSLSEILKNLIVPMMTLPELFGAYDMGSLQEMRLYYTIVYDYTVMFSYYTTMFSITAERYFIILLGGKKYQTYWDIRKTKYLVVFTWLLGITGSIAIALMYRFASLSFIEYFVYLNNRDAAVVVYSSPLIDAAFIVLAIAVYHKIFQKYSRSQRKIRSEGRSGGPATAPENGVGGSPQRKRRRRHSGSAAATTAENGGSGAPPQQSTFKLFVHSSFFIVALLIGSFLIFTIIPDMIFSYHETSDLKIARRLDTICYILFATSDLADVFIYVFVQEKVRKTLWKKLHKLAVCANEAPRNDEWEAFILQSYERDSRLQQYQQQQQQHHNHGLRTSTYL